jgi:hypothetical protein
MPKSPSRKRYDLDQAHVTVRYCVAVAIFTSLIISVVYTALAGIAMQEVHDEGSNHRNSSDTSLTDKEQDYHRNNEAAFTAWIFTALLTFIYIAMKV